MPEQRNDDGSVSYSVKDLLEQLNRKVDALDEKLDQKADRERVHDMSSRVAALELTTVRRDGPVMQEIREYERRLESVSRELASLQDGLTTHIERAMQQAAVNAQKAADRSFTRREKVIVGAAAIIGALGTAISTIVLIVQVGINP